MLDRSPRLSVLKLGSRVGGGGQYVVGRKAGAIKQ
jgi:hypothetical protein